MKTSCIYVNMVPRLFRRWLELSADDIQQSWLAFKKKVRRRAIFLSKQSTERESSGLDTPYQKSKNDPPTASIPANWSIFE